MSTIFGTDSFAMKRPRLSLVDPGSAEVAASSSTPSRPLETQSQPSLKISKIRPSTTHLRSVDPESDRQRALEAWLQVLKIDLSCSVTGRLITKTLESGLTPDEQVEEVSFTISMISRGKSANTLSQRASAISQFLAWSVKNCAPALPVIEENIFRYMRSSELSDRAALDCWKH